MDEIRIQGLKVFAHHGVLEEEKQEGQYFYVDAVLRRSLREAGLSDVLTLTENYAVVSQEIEEFLQKQVFDLIETVAEKLAEFLLIRHEKVQEILITIHKPGAPIPVPFEDVTVSIIRKRHIAFIALGSNMGDRRNSINTAVRKLSEIPGNRVLKISELIETEPYGGVKQDDFLNGVLKLETLLFPQELLHELNRIEGECGRVREIHWGPRTLDLDILFYDDSIINEENLTVPHCDLQNRAFVLKPMAQIEAWYRHPVFHESIAQLLEHLNEK